MAAIKLDEATPSSEGLTPGLLDFDPGTPEPSRGVSGVLLDQLRAAQAGSYDVGESYAGAADVVAGFNPYTSDADRAGIRGAREFFHQGAKETTESMSPQAQRRAWARVPCVAGWQALEVKRHRRALSK
jgi:hypothetical protein